MKRSILFVWTLMIGAQAIAQQNDLSSLARNESAKEAEWPGKQVLVEAEQLDTTQLKGIAEKAFKDGDMATVDEAVGKYLGAVKGFHSEQVRFLKSVTGTVNSISFKFMLKNASAIEARYPEQSVSGFLIGVIERDLLTPNIGKKEWSEMEKQSKKLFGIIGEEAYLQTAVFYAINNDDWNLFNRTASTWFTEYGKKRQWIGAELLNRMGWAVFSKTFDKPSLKCAVTLVERSLEMNRNAHTLDTYANLYYKLGNKRKAMQLQELAVSSSKDESIVLNLEKMKRGEPTWPVEKNKL